ncbi:hypothetical protein KC19_VG092400 [Ceratodon purpureus]|uniref:Uncharacterized protein n=1 Tax=Ceratodon purpureus TaxID=3225 RepID=A0A8T0HNN0_CERPU|nr:hypothetical protein KC19_VG092400 [Ceratodon purpureus]
MSAERGRLLATVRQRYSFSPDYGGELGVGLSPSSPAPSSPAPLRRTAENLLWLAAAVFAIYYGDSRHHLFHALFYDPRIRSLFATHPQIRGQMGVDCTCRNPDCYPSGTDIIPAIFNRPLANLGLLDSPTAVHFVHGVCCDFTVSSTLWTRELSTLRLTIRVLLISNTLPVDRCKIRTSACCS